MDFRVLRYISDIEQFMFFFLRLSYRERRLEGDKRETVPRRVAFGTSPVFILFLTIISCNLATFPMDSKKNLWMHHHYLLCTKNNSNKVSKSNFITFYLFVLLPVSYLV